MCRKFMIATFEKAFIQIGNKNYLYEQAGLNTANIYVYEREELTYTSVAAQIANASADAGISIYSAANLYGLDFLLICIEKNTVCLFPTMRGTLTWCRIC